ncbi:MAG TPA: TIGR03936 family radical SAM-associated protein [Candidatus Omnitrophota bacterium]|nr:TIGR03936 family radical SAM-associated protein [Candidatus Omnitrophota bacterium]HRZ15582.1 TIGR03936 family radical SAM-associated protein [Candidatus Omnitrophota bacterium]
MQQVVFKIEFTFSKKERMKFISHLDLMRLLIRALRRADVPLKLTEGFSPHPKLSIKRALKLGLESEAEEATIVLRELVRPEEFKTRLQRQLPAGISILTARWAG